MTPEQSARFAKATGLADVLDAVLVDTGATPEQLTEECWRLADQVVAAKAGRDVRPASEKTRALVVRMLNERARWRQPGVDVFAGLV